MLKTILSVILITMVAPAPLTMHMVWGWPGSTTPTRWDYSAIVVVLNIKVTTSKQYTLLQFSVYKIQDLDIHHFNIWHSDLVCRKFRIELFDQEVSFLCKCFYQVHYVIHWGLPPPIPIF